MVYGYLKRVIVTPAVYPRLVEFLHFDIQSTGLLNESAIMIYTGLNLGGVLPDSFQSFTLKCPYESRHTQPTISVRLNGKLQSPLQQMYDNKT